MKNIAFYIITVIVFFALCANVGQPCLAMTAEEKRTVEDMVYGREYVKAVNYLEEYLAKHKKDYDALVHYARLTTDTLVEETFDPEEGFKAYETAYYMLDYHNDEESAKSMELLDEIMLNWSSSIMEVTLDAPTDPERAFWDLSGEVAPLYVIFEAEWCGWCKKMRETVESFDSNYSDRAYVIRCDVDYDCSDLKKTYDVSGIPFSLFVDRKGNEATFVGYMDERELFAAYLAVTDFFYEEKAKKGETLKEYIGRLYKAIKDLSDDDIDKLIQEGQDALWEIL